MLYLNFSRDYYGFDCMILCAQQCRDTKCINPYSIYTNGFDSRTHFNIFTCSTRDKYDVTDCHRSDSNTKGLNDTSPHYYLINQAFGNEIENYTKIFEKTVGNDPVQFDLVKRVEKFPDLFHYKCEKFGGGAKSKSRSYHVEKSFTLNLISIFIFLSMLS